MTDNQVIHVLYLIAVFYGYRLRFIIGDGGLVVLSSISEEDKVNAAYKEILDSFEWAGDKHPSEFQSFKIYSFQRIKKKIHTYWANLKAM